VIGGDAELRALVDAATLNAQVAQSLYQARKAAGLTQGALAELVGTTQSVISQLENSDYEGHSLSMLRRIASVLDLRVEMKLVPKSAHANPPDRRRRDLRRGTGGRNADLAHRR
jgi:transcriptional regulator with XRE-family HTH domain